MEDALELEIALHDHVHRMAIEAGMNEALALNYAKHAIEIFNDPQDLAECVIATFGIHLEKLKRQKIDTA